MDVPVVRGILVLYGFQHGIADASGLE
jgi:hypothetical protein